MLVLIAKNLVYGTDKKFEDALRKVSSAGIAYHKLIGN
jgi:hypothetical protein